MCNWPSYAAIARRHISASFYCRNDVDAVGLPRRPGPARPGAVRAVWRHRWRCDGPITELAAIDRLLMHRPSALLPLCSPTPVYAFSPISRYSLVANGCPETGRYAVVTATIRLRVDGRSTVYQRSWFTIHYLRSHVPPFMRQCWGLPRRLAQCMSLQGWGKLMLRCSH